MMKESKAISIDKVRGNDIDSLLTLYVDIFYDREPLTKIIGLSKERMISVARSMYAESDMKKPSQGLYWVARDRTEENREIGFIVCDDPADAGEQQLPENLTDREIEKFSVISALLEEIRSPVKETMGLGEGINFHISAVGVSSGYEGKGIARRLLQTALLEACNSGFQYAFSECTSIASRVMHEKCGFESIKSFSLNKYVFKGKYPFAGCDLDIHLMWKTFSKEKP